MDRDVFAEDNLKVLFGLELYGCIELESQVRKISAIRKRIRNEKGVVFPVVWIESSDEIPERNVQIIMLGEVKEEYTCNLDNPDCFSETLDYVCDVIYKNLNMFKDFEYEAEIKKLEKERSRIGYKKILSYYKCISPNNKMQFHYLKKIASFNFPEDLREFEIALEAGVGHSPDPVQARKVSYRRLKRNWSDDQIF